MNCQRFEDVVIDLARDQIMDAELQGDAMEHSRGCVRCEARLVAERKITIQMQELALLTQSASAPTRIQESLLQVFEQQLSIKTSLANTSRRRYWVAAIAALFMIAFGLFVARAWQAAPQRHVTTVDQKLLPEPGHPVETASTSVPSPEPALVNDETEATSGRRFATLRHDRRNFEVKGAQKPNHFDDEVTTDFIPVTYGGVANLDAGGQIVRVQLPRSRLASFGLPVNMDRADEKVKADVLIGVDGQAHAIRFVGNRTASDMSK